MVGMLVPTWTQVLSGQMKRLRCRAAHYPEREQKVSGSVKSALTGSELVAAL